MVNFSSWLIMSIFIVFQAQRSSGASLNIDLVIVVHDGVQRWKTETQNAESVFRQFFKLFDIRTRLGIVAHRRDGVNEPNWASVLSSEGLVSGNISIDIKTIPGLKSELAPGLKIARGLFDASTTKPKAVLLLTMPEHSSLSGTAEEAKEMQAAGINVYVVFRPRNSANRDSHSKTLLELVGGKPTNMLTLPEYKDIADGAYNNSLQWFKNVFENELCYYEQKCFYTDQNRATCAKAFYTPAVTIAGGDCNAVEKPLRGKTFGSCGKDDCKMTCDDLWSLSSCETGCGKIVNRTGTGRWKTLDYCPSTIQCPKCTTPSPTTTTDQSGAPPSKGTSMGVILGVTIPLVVIALIAAAVAGFVFLKRRKGFSFRKGGFLKGGWRLCKKGKKGAAKGAPKKGDSGKKASIKSGKKGDSAKKAVEVESEKKADSGKKATEVKSGKKAAAEGKSGSGKKAASGKGKKGAGAAPETEDEPKVKSMTTVPEAKVKSMTTMPEK